MYSNEKVVKESHGIVRYLAGRAVVQAKKSYVRYCKENGSKKQYLQKIKLSSTNRLFDTHMHKLL